MSILISHPDLADCRRLFLSNYKVHAHIGAHAFETLGCPAVEFRTHWLNHQSRDAIARLGAKQDGVLRSHTRSSDGVLRDTVVFSILEHEWPMVRNSLQLRLAKQR